MSCTHITSTVILDLIITSNNYVNFMVQANQREELVVGHVRQGLAKMATIFGSMVLDVIGQRQ